MADPCLACETWHLYTYFRKRFSNQLLQRLLEVRSPLRTKSPSCLKASADLERSHRVAFRSQRWQGQGQDVEQGAVGLAFRHCSTAQQATFVSWIETGFGDKMRQSTKSLENHKVIIGHDRLCFWGPGRSTYQKGFSQYNIMGFWKCITFSTSTGCFVTLTEPVIALTEPVNHKTQTD